MRIARFGLVAAALVLAASPGPARAAPAPALVDHISADRGPSSMISINKRVAGDVALDFLAKEVNAVIENAQIDDEITIARNAADIAAAFLTDDVRNADHAVDIAINASSRETGQRALSVNISTTRIRSTNATRPSLNREPWTPRAHSPTAAPKAAREGSNVMHDDAATNAASGSSGPNEESSGSRSRGTRAANSG